MKLVRYFRSSLAQRAQLIILPNEKRCNFFVEQTGVAEEKVQCVWNCPSLEEVAVESKTWCGGDFWLIYQGSLNEARLPLTILDTIKVLPERVKLRVVGYETIGSHGFVHKLITNATEMSVRERLEVHGPVSRQELYKIIKSSQLGLCFMPRDTVDVNMRAMVGASNKVFDCFACGIPALVTDLDEWQETFVNKGVALACDPANPESLRAAVRKYLDDSVKYGEAGHLALNWIKRRWNYEIQFKPVFDVMNSTGF
jgi:glycosyltransferase involved in cell wall biosynthesis